MTDVKEQRSCIKFFFKLGNTVSETHGMLKEAFGYNALGQTPIYQWFKRFKNGRMSVDDEERSGRSSTGTRPKKWHNCERLPWKTDDERIMMFATLSDRRM
jgi:hypothetical protein